MEIMPAKPDDLVEVLFLMRECINNMNEKGLMQWNPAHPGPREIEKDLTNNIVFLIKDKGICKGMIMLSEKLDPVLKNIKWKNNKGKALLIKRMAVHPNWQGQGIGKTLIEHAGTYAKKNKYKSLRMDVMESNMSALEISQKFDFEEVGEYKTEYQNTPYRCFEKFI